MRTSQTSSSLASELNFWVLSLDQVIVILLSIVNFASKFLKEYEWFKFGVVMTFRHYVILDVIWSYFGVHKATYAARKVEKLKKVQRMKTCHDYAKTWHDLARQYICSRHWKRVTMTKSWHNLVKPQFSCLLLIWKCVTIYLKCDTILGEFLCLFKLKSILTGVTNWEEQSATLRPKDG